MAEEKGMGLEKLGVPIVLLSAIWGAFDVILKSIEMLNKSRDTAVELLKKCRLVVPVNGALIEEARHIFFNDWLFLWLGTCWFLLLFTFVIALIPHFIASHKVPAYQKRLCWMAATLPGLAFIRMLIGGFSDMPLFFPLKPGN